jgi:DNA-binding transcriptional LysR family regulator
VQEDSLQAFVTVAEHRHFRRAAAMLFVVPSTLSRRLTALERATGLRLVDRTAGAVSLTPQGEQFLPVAHRLLAEFGLARAAASDIAAGVRPIRPRRAV